MIGLLRGGLPPFPFDRAGYSQSFFARLSVKFNAPCGIKQFGEIVRLQAFATQASRRSRDDV
jgi:hypothetical protein